MNSAHERMTHAQRAAIGATAGDQARAGQAVALADPRPADRRPRVAGPDDCFRLLAWAAALDGRERGEYEAAAWWEVIGPRGFAFDDVKAAITEHYRHSRYPVMPADIIQIIEEGDL